MDRKKTVFRPIISHDDGGIEKGKRFDGGRKIRRKSNANERRRGGGRNAAGKEGWEAKGCYFISECYCLVECYCFVS